MGNCRLIKSKTISHTLRVWLLVVFCGCAASAQKGKHHHVTPYYENLSLVRPEFKKEETGSNNNQSNTNPVPADIDFKANDIARLLDLKLDSIDANNRKYQTQSGYRILIYSGSSSDEANNIRRLVYQNYEGYNVYTDYKQPSFRVKVGNYTDKVQANYYLNDLRKSFPNAMIVPDEIVLEK